MNGAAGFPSFTFSEHQGVQNDEAASQGDSGTGVDVDAIRGSGVATGDDSGEGIGSGCMSAERNEAAKHSQSDNIAEADDGAVDIAALATQIRQQNSDQIQVCYGDNTAKDICGFGGDGLI